MVDIQKANEELKELLRQRRQHRDEQGRFAKKSVYEVAKELGLDVRDTRVAVLANKNPENVEKEVLALAAKMHFTRPSEADRPSHIARERPSLPLSDRLEEEYREGSRNLRGDALIRFQREMRRKGWQK